MKRQIYPPFYILGILIILIFYSCDNEEIQLNTETSVISQLKNELKLEEFTNQNLTVNWDNIHTTEKENFEIFEIETNEINPTKIKSNLFQSDLKHELIAVKKGDELFSYVIKAYSSLNYKLFPCSIQNLGDFTGTLIVFDLNGKKLDELVIFNGASKNVSGNNVIAPLHEAINLFASNKNLTSKTNDCFLTLTTNLTSTFYTDHYYYVTVGNYTTLDYSHTTSVTVNSSSTTVVPSPCGNKGQNNFLDEYFTKRSTYIDEKPNILDPCTTADIVTSISQSAGYSAAINSIKSANTSVENSITLGKDANRNITQAPMNTGGPVSVKTNTSWAGAFGAIHNHPNNTPISGGDIYAAVTLNSGNSNFTTTFVYTDGEMYAAVVTDLAAAQAFVAAYPADLKPGYNPEFPDFIFDQFLDLVNIMGSNTEGKTNAIAFVLDKNNAGITFLKQDSSGRFNPIQIKETTNANGSKTYTSTPCN